MGNRNESRRENIKPNAPPGLDFLFASHVVVKDPLEVGQFITGRRLIISTEPGARIAGPRMNGQILPGSTLVGLVRSDGVVETEGHVFFDMDDGHRILARINGLLSMSAEAAREVAEGRPYDPTWLYSRSLVRFEAADDGPYAWLNRNLHIAKASRTADGGIDSTVWQVL